MFSTLVSVDDLAAHLHDPQWVIFDCRHDLGDTEKGRRAYQEAHIPGARFVHLDADLSGPKTGTNGRHPLPDPRVFCERLGALGLRHDKPAVAYDDSGGYYAARLWWMLRWVGHDAAAVLDGGWDAWTAAGQPVTTDHPAIEATQFACRLRPAMAVDVRFVQDNLHAQDTRILDARSPDRFRGENETLDPVGGHIPGALNRFFRANLDARGCFKPAAELQREFAALLRDASSSKVVHQCGSGVTACHNLLAMEIAGLPGSKLFAGSWSEWCGDPGRPVAR
jgi:thiosulfate/3-mercaptopyruvate sulfurtransferase